MQGISILVTTKIKQILDAGFWMLDISFKKDTLLRLLVMLLILLPGSILAQEQTDSSVKYNFLKRKVWYLTFKADIGIKAIKVCHRGSYEGEYLDGFEWSWVNEDSTACDYLDYYNFKHIRFSAMLEILKNLNFGFSYQGVLLKKRWDVEAPFFAITGIVDYSWFIKKVPGLFLNPSVSLGTYQGEQIYTGTGDEVFSEFKLGAGYRFKERLSLSMWIADNYLFYKEKSISKVYNKAQQISSEWNYVHMGISVGYRFFLVPD